MTSNYAPAKSSQFVYQILVTKSSQINFLTAPITMEIFERYEPLTIIQYTMKPTTDQYQNDRKNANNLRRLLIAFARITFSNHISRRRFHNSTVYRCYSEQPVLLRDQSYKSVLLRK